MGSREEGARIKGRRVGSWCANYQGKGTCKGRGVGEPEL